MNFGKEIQKMRKKCGFSQEELSEKIGVSRQTISKWELEETYPDIKQSLELSKIFNVSLDELTNNSINDIIINRIVQNERKIKITNRLVKMLLSVISIIAILFIIYIFVFTNIRSNQRKIFGIYNITCELDEEKYEYEMQFNENYIPINSGGSAYIENHIDIAKYNDANQVRAHIEDYFKNYDGSCETKERYMNTQKNN